MAEPSRIGLIPSQELEESRKAVCPADRDMTKKQGWLTVAAIGVELQGIVAPPVAFTNTPVQPPIVCCVEEV